MSDGASAMGTDGQAEPALFALRRVDERVWPHVRGAALLGDVFGSGAVTAVAATAAHIAAVVAGAGAAHALLVFDAVPPAAHCSDDTIAQTRVFITTGTCDAGASLGPLCLGTVRECPLHVGFLEPGPAAPLRLALADAAGTLRLWAWDAAACVWRPDGEHPGVVPTAPAPAPAPALAYSPQTQTLCCATPAGHVSLRQLVASDPGTSTTTSLTAAVTADIGAYERCVATPHGVWFVRADAVAFVPAAPVNPVTATLPSKAVRARLADAEHRLCAHLAAAHPFSHELVVPDAHGRLAVFTPPAPPARTVAAACAGTLAHPAVLAAARAMLVVRHALALLTPAGVACFDLASGTALGTVPVVSSSSGDSNGDSSVHLWGPGADDAAARCGLWGPGVDGLALLQPPGALAYARALVRAATEADAGSTAEQRDAAARAAVDVCADWGLDQWVARLAFELLLRGRGTGAPATVAALARALAQHVQNPALVAGLLAGRNMNDLLEAELARFLAQMQAQGAADAAGATTDEDRQTAYELCTPLNNKLAAPLAQLLELLRLEKHGAADAPATLFPGALDTPLLVDAVDPQTVPTLDWQTLATFVRESPHTCASLICQGTGLSLPLLAQLHESPDLPLRALQLSPALLAPLRSVHGTDTSRNPTLLDMLCAALYADQPRLLPALVPAVVASNLAPRLDTLATDTPGRHSSAARLVAARILKALPAACPSSSAASSSPDSLDAEQTVAVSRLLEINGQHLNALLTLLQGDLWDDAVALLARLHESRTPSETAQLFETALHTALRRRKTECLPKLWPFLPCTMRPLDLAHIIACHAPVAAEGSGSSGGEVVQHPLDKNAPFTVGMFREAFLQLFQQQQQEEEQASA